MATQVNTTMTPQPKNELYTAEAPVEGGREGHGRTSDGRLDVDLSVPASMSGDDGPGTSPEQLFAVGYAAWFQSTHLGIARGRKLDATGSQISSRVGLVRSTLAASVYRSRLTCTHRASPLKRRAG
jgi:organic hydroperoxide reductase OsmC/OhrA